MALYYSNSIRVPVALPLVLLMLMFAMAGRYWGLGRWWEQLLHNQSALTLKARLLYRPNTVVTSIPVHVG